MRQWLSAQNVGQHLKDATPNQAARTSKKKRRSRETHENAATVEMHDRNDYGFISYLMGGLILIIVGVFAVLDLSIYRRLASGQNLAIMLLMIGAIIIVGAVYGIILQRENISNNSLAT